MRRYPKFEMLLPLRNQCEWSRRMDIQNCHEIECARRFSCKLISEYHIGLLTTKKIGNLSKHILAKKNNHFLGCQLISKPITHLRIWFVPETRIYDKWNSLVVDLQHIQHKLMTETPLQARTDWKSWLNEQCFRTQKKFD